jgi:hypothetical protein
MTTLSIALGLVLFGISYAFNVRELRTRAKEKPVVTRLLADNSVMLAAKSTAPWSLSMLAIPLLLLGAVTIRFGASGPFPDGLIFFSLGFFPAACAALIVILAWRRKILIVAAGEFRAGSEWPTGIRLTRRMAWEDVAEAVPRGRSGVILCTDASGERSVRIPRSLLTASLSDEDAKALMPDGPRCALEAALSADWGTAGDRGRDRR